MTIGKVHELYQLKSCGVTVGARGVKFTARKAGKEKLEIFGDVVKNTVR